MPGDQSPAKMTPDKSGLKPDSSGADSVDREFIPGEIGGN